jgi:uncharacterized membrane protein
MKTKYILLTKSAVLLILVAVFLFVSNISIKADGDNEKSVDQVIKEIRKELNLKDNDKIDPGKVPDNLLEELGDAVMSKTHPDEREHKWMDDMMGGEGSDSLKAMHRTMGYRYLDGAYSGYNGRLNYDRSGFGNYMMWPGSMMGTRRNNYSNWNNRNWFFKNRWIGGAIMFIIWIAILGFIGYLAYFAVTKNTKLKNQEESALEILKRRYAKGEINKKEFEEKKKDIL